MEELGLTAGLVLTLMIYSYLIRDNLLYRIAVYLFVGLTAGLITIVTVESVLLPWFDLTFGAEDARGVGVGLIPVILLILLLFKSSRRLGRFGNLGLAVIIGVGTAVALVGALAGTLIPLSVTTINAGHDNALRAMFIFIGVASSLIHFQYLARRTPTGQIERPRLIRWISSLGEAFLMVTLGALYAAAILTSVTIFSDRMSFVLTEILGG